MPEAGYIANESVISNEDMPASGICKVGYLSFYAHYALTCNLCSSIALTISTFDHVRVVIHKLKVIGIVPMAADVEYGRICTTLRLFVQTMLYVKVILQQHLVIIVVTGCAEIGCS